MTNNLGAPRIADGQADGQWATANDMTGRHDAAMTEPLPVSFDSSDTVTLTALQFTSNFTFQCIAGSPAPDAPCTLNVPNVNALAATLKRGAFTVINDLAQDLTIQVSGQSETPPELSPGQRSIMVMDGANVYVAVPSGTIGADGADGTDPGILFSFDTTTTDADPGNGDLRANNASLASATFLYIDDLDRSGNNVEAHLLTWDDSTNTPKGHLYLSRASDGAQTIFTVGAVTDASGYIKLAVTYVSGATSFTNADAISAQFYRAGDVGGNTFAGALVKKSVDETGVNAASGYLVPWTAEEYDTDSIHDNVTNNSKLFVPVGWTKIRMAFGLDISLQAASDYIRAVIIKNGSVLTFPGTAFDASEISAVTTHYLAGTTAAVLVTGGTDYFEVWVDTESDTSITLQAAGSWFSMEKVA